MAETVGLVGGVLGSLVLAVLRVTVLARVGRAGQAADVRRGRSAGEQPSARDHGWEVRAGRPAVASGRRGERSAEVITRLGLGLGLALVPLALLIGCGSSGAASPQLVAQCRATVLPVEVVSTTLQHLQRTRQLPSQSAAELRKEQSALNAAVSALRAPDASARGHALVTAVERARAWITTGRSVPERLSSEFAAAGHDLVAGCQQGGND